MQRVARLGRTRRFLATLSNATDASMPAQYDPLILERGRYAWWEGQGLFRPAEADGRPSFSVAIPPPNVTGSLHIGHALTNTLQDVLIRWRRMHGDRVVWVPGLDHAGIATQSIVEKHLSKTTQKTRHDLGREPFVAEIWKWYQQYGGRINTQLVRPRGKARAGIV